MRIFITGCARTGTTLVKNLFYAFEGVEVIDKEISLRQFKARPTDAPILVGKRTARTIFSYDLPSGELREQAKQLTGLTVINCVRGKAAVMRKGRGMDVPHRRYDAAMRQAEQHKKLIAYTIRYEDLVAEPNIVQIDMAVRLGLKTEHFWSTYPEFVPDRAFDIIDTSRFVGYGPRPIGELT